MKKIITTIFILVSVLMLAACNKQVKIDDVLAAVEIGYQTDNNSQQVTKDVKLPTKIAKYEAASVTWACNNQSVITISGETGKVTQSTQDVIVKLTATVSFNKQEKSRDFSIKVLAKKSEPVDPVDPNPIDPVQPDPKGNLTYHFDFTKLTIEKDYVKTLTEFVVTNKVAGSLAFERLNSSINEATGNGAGQKGVILGIRSGNNWESSLLKTKAIVNKLTQIEMTYTIWGDVKKQNLDYAKGIYLQTSLDNTNWTTVKDIKGDVNLEEGWFSSTVSVSIPETNAYLRIFVESAGTQSTTHQMRLIVKELKLYTTDATTNTPEETPDPKEPEQPVTPGLNTAVVISKVTNESLIPGTNGASKVGLDEKIFVVNGNIIVVDKNENGVGLFADIRLYSSEDGSGNQLEIKIADGYEITKVIITFSEAKRTPTGTISFGTKTIDLENINGGTTTITELMAQSFMIKNTTAAKGNQIRIASIEITYQAKK